MLNLSKIELQELKKESRFVKFKKDPLTHLLDPFQNQKLSSTQFIFSHKD